MSNFSASGMLYYRLLVLLATYIFIELTNQNPKDFKVPSMALQFLSVCYKCGQLWPGPHGFTLWFPLLLVAKPASTAFNNSLQVCELSTTGLRQEASCSVQGRSPRPGSSALPQAHWEAGSGLAPRPEGTTELFAGAPSCYLTQVMQWGWRGHLFTDRCDL